ncbi:DNA-binding transcriptional regulator, AcrR family [Nonomuraea maritima]|uniref:DNA-binding transcriptional regulator, AcrR family n=1 Tax=Nonomuraea maritima TaxID=683260 RepID=A0A1G8RVE7_9ACTN|nr:TetR/AcrR family transcriptional regulator [Nonomuraea maritima]SDJ20893.1 DNA-binding transcriptional regulator, AcrR family [Nonomuraea maritima]
MSTQESGAARPAGRPRSEKAEKAIIEATLDLIGEGVGVAELSIEAIASRAGVGKTTIYRRWSNKEDLVVDALATMKAPLPPLSGTSVRDDLISLLEAMRSESGQARSRCVMNIVMSEADRHRRITERFMERAVEPRRRAMREVIERGIVTGELRPDLDVDMGMAIISGTMLWHTKWGPAGDLSPELPEQIIDAALAGMAP